MRARAKTSRVTAPAPDALIDTLADISQARARVAFLRRHPELWDASVVERIYARVVRLARTDLDRADRLASAAHWIAVKLGDEACRAQSLRAIGHVHHARGEYAEALEHQQAARAAYLGLGRDVVRALVVASGEPLLERCEPQIALLGAVASVHEASGAGELTHGGSDFAHEHQLEAGPEPASGGGFDVASLAMAALKTFEYAQVVVIAPDEMSSEL